MTKSTFSTIDLILLGLIRNHPMSAYDLSKMQGIYELVKISTPAIYKNIRRLEHAGYLQFSMEKAGNNPEKKVYSITEKGEQQFQELLELCAVNPINYYFDFNVPLLFVNSIDKDSAEQIISTIKSQLQTRQKYLLNQIEKYKHLPFPVVSLARQHKKVNDALLEWMDEFWNDYQKLK